MTTDIEALSDYIREEQGYSGPLDPDVDLLEEQILDSFSIVQVAMFIQQHFNVELDAEDLVRANLAKLSSMIALIERKRAES